MFTTPMFYIGWVIIAMLPLTVAIVAPQKIRYKIIASVCVLAVAFALMCGMYAEKENDFDRAGIMGFTLTVAVSTSFPGLPNGEHRNLSIILATNADTLKNFLQL